MSLPLVGVRPSLYQANAVSGEIIPEELPRLQRARPFYFEDSQVVLQASHNITMFPSTL